MTRPSRREVERAVEELEAEHGDGDQLVVEIEETVVFSGWSAEEPNEDATGFDWERTLKGRDLDPEDLEPGDEVVVERWMCEVAP